MMQTKENGMIIVSIYTDCHQNMFNSFKQSLLWCSNIFDHMVMTTELQLLLTVAQLR